MRSEARVLTAIWQDPDFRALPRTAQFMYLFLLSQSDLSHCGVVPFRPERWAQMGADSTVPAIEADIRTLEQSHPPFVVVDRVTGELLIRSLLRRDGMLSAPKMVRSVQTALYAVESARLRDCLALELQRCLSERFVHPEYLSPGGSKRTPPPDPLEIVITKLYPQVNTLSDTLSDTLRDTLRDTHRDRDRDRDVLTEPPTTATPPLEKPPLRSGFSSTPPHAEIAKIDRRDDVERLCDHLADRVGQSFGKRPDVTAAWRRAARLMLDRDGLAESRIHAAIDWCQDDAFWYANIRSMTKLREKYEMLQAQALRQRRQQNGHGGRRQQETDDMFAAALERARQRDAQEGTDDARGSRGALPLRQGGLPAASL